MVSFVSEARLLLKRYPSHLYSFSICANCFLIVGNFNSHWLLHGPLLYTRYNSMVLKWTTSQSFSFLNYSLIISLKYSEFPGTCYCCLVSIQQVYQPLCAFTFFPIRPGFFQLITISQCSLWQDCTELVKTGLEQVVPFLWVSVLFRKLRKWSYFIGLVWTKGDNAWWVFSTGRGTC